MLRRLLIGLLKGIVIGGAIGALLHFALNAPAITVGWINYLLYGTVALLAGVVAGQPPWRHGAWVASILKGVFGFGVGAGLYALVSHFLKLPVDGLAGVPPGTALASAPLLFAPVVATAYATVVELDDGGEPPPEEKKKTGVRVLDVDDIDIGEEVPAAREEKKGGARAKR